MEFKRQDNFLIATMDDDSEVPFCQAVYAKTKNAKTGKNKPSSLVEILNNKKSQKEEKRSFNSGADFDKEWRRLTNGNRTR